ncbi:hypothetical protein [Exiguobacterium oxidotolerans]|uniref:hypothetical protein n=1 Tax=Exiguobacterium oxidotolerans TaxID=223958 RepID=UPI000494D43F|nr:hypothetical protein [Exiguobacterium oxidotolerans]
MNEQHDKETDPITSGNQMTNDEIAGRDKEAAPDTRDKHDQAKNQKADAEKSADASDEQPDLSHEADDDSDVEANEETNQDN